MDYHAVSILVAEKGVAVPRKNVLTYHECQENDRLYLWWTPYAIVLHLSHAIKQGNSLLTATAGLGRQRARKDQSQNVNIFPVQCISISLRIKLECAIHQAVETVYLIQQLRKVQHGIHDSHLLFIDSA